MAESALAFHVKIAPCDLPVILLQMQSAKPTSPFVVVQPSQARAFSNPLRVRILMLCTNDESSLSILRKRLGMPLSKLHYHVSRLLDTGLLVVSRTERRPGRPIRYYRSTAKSFVVQQGHLAELPSDKWSSELRESLSLEHGRSNELLHYSSTADGKILVKLEPDRSPMQSRGMELWRLMRLGAKERASLAQELKQLLDRYAGSAAAPGAPTFLVHAAFAPALNRD